MLHILMLFLSALASMLASPQIPSPRAQTVAPCEEGALAAKQPAFPVPPPVFVRRSDLPRLMVFVHGLQGDAVMSWRSRSGAYWPTLVALDSQFREFDVFVHEYVVKPNAAVRLGEAVEQFVSVAFDRQMVSRYRDIVFVTEGDGVFFVRELLKRVPPFARRVSMIFVAGRLDEVLHPLPTESITLSDGDRQISWREFRQSDAAGWARVEPQPWTHCAVLGERKQPTVARDEGSSFCSTMPLVIAGADWQALRPSCYLDAIHQALRQSVGLYTPRPTQTKALPTSTHTVSSGSINVACEEVLEGILELSLPLNPDAEELLSVEPSIVDIDHLKAQTATVERVVGNSAIVRYRIVGLDSMPLPLPGMRNCPGGGHGTVQLKVIKRPKG